MAGKVWFITGSSTGFGRLMTELVLKNGDVAVATLRRPEVLADLVSKNPEDKLLVLKLDVRQPQEIKDTFAAATKRFGRIDVVFNNAGYPIVGELEGVPEEMGRALFDTNVWGAVNVTKEALRVFREVNEPPGGTLLQVSSQAAIQADAGFAHYCGSKYALNGMSTALAAELNPEWNVKVVIVEPGSFATPVLGNTLQAPSHPAYTKPGSAVASLRQWIAKASGEVAADPARAVEAIYRVAQMPDPPLLFPLGKDAVQRARGHAARLLADADRVASLSDDLGERTYSSAV